MGALIENLEQGSPEWHAMRKNRIGASDAPVIMEKSPWKTPYQLWEEKVGLREQGAPNDAMRLGVELEPVARELFIQKTGIAVSPKVMVSEEYSWMMASFDGVDEECKNLVEIKVANEQDHLLALQGKVPSKYYYQLQHQMNVAGLDHMYYFSYRNGEGAIVQIGTNTTDIKTLVEAEMEFYKCMIDFVMPPLSAKDCTEQTDDKWLHAAAEYLDYDKQIAMLEEKRENQRKYLIALANGRNSSGGGLKLVKSIRKGNVQYSKVPELEHVDLEKYRKEPSEFWRICK